jgi:exosortase
MALSAALALAMAWLYASTWRGLVSEWLSSADASYGLVLLVVASAVAWRRREALMRALQPHPAFAPGATALLAGLAVYLAGQLGADVFLTRVSFVLVLAGILWLVAGGGAVRVMAAPLLFLLMAVPLPALLVNAVTLPLQLLASRISEATLTAAGVAVFRDGNLLELPSGTLEVAEACSGLRSIVSLAAIGALLAWTDPRWPRRVVIFSASLPIAVAMNCLRISATGLACEAWGPRAAAGSWHTFGGWATFIVSMIALVRVQQMVSADRARPWTISQAAQA